MTRLKEIEREKRVNDALRNVRLAESKVAMRERQVKEIEQSHDVSDVHVAAWLQNAKRDLRAAQTDQRQAIDILRSAEADDEEIDEAIERMSI